MKDSRNQVSGKRIHIILNRCGPLLCVSTLEPPNRETPCIVTFNIPHFLSLNHVWAGKQQTWILKCAVCLHLFLLVFIRYASHTHIHTHTRARANVRTHTHSIIYYIIFITRPDAPSVIQIKLKWKLRFLLNNFVSYLTTRALLWAVYTYTHTHTNRHRRRERESSRCIYSRVARVRDHNRKREGV